MSPLSAKQKLFKNFVYYLPFMKKSVWDCLIVYPYNYFQITAMYIKEDIQINPQIEKK